VAAVIPIKEPESIIAGDTLKFDITLADYPAGDGWTLSYNLVNKDGSYPFSSTANGNDHRVNVAIATTANWVAGFYTLTGYVSNGTERYQVFPPARVEILRDPSLTDAADTRSIYQKILDLMEAAMLSGASRETAEVSAEGVTVRWKDGNDFLTRLNWVKSQVNASNGKSKRILTRFSPR
jgi:hypothetical protein